MDWFDFVNKPDASFSFITKGDTIDESRNIPDILYTYSFSMIVCTIPVIGLILDVSVELLTIYVNAELSKVMPNITVAVLNSCCQ